MDDLLLPDWPAPPQVRAFSTTRLGGVSRSPWRSFNLADHVGDDPLAVAENRRLLSRRLGLPQPPRWLHQVHGIGVSTDSACGVEADAVFTRTAGRVCGIMTADCLPVLLCDQEGSAVAAVHAGWRGLCGGIIERSVAQFSVAGDQLLAWLGPAIGPQAFEVGDEVRQAFVQQAPQAAQGFVAVTGVNGKWLADLYLLARQRLSDLGIERVYGGDFCTYSDPRRFFSYRRDGQTGRMASLIWLHESST